MKLVLHPGSEELKDIYSRAFKDARELYIVSAYLTAWTPPRKLNGRCNFQMIIGKDFGLTRKKACKDLIKWLPARHKNELWVASEIGGFHPKGMFWKDRGGRHHALVGSSNLTEAAFSTNYEANLYSIINEHTYKNVIAWFERVLTKSCSVNDKWLKGYKEATLKGGMHKNGKEVPKPSRPDFPSPKISDSKQVKQGLRIRRSRLNKFNKIRRRLIKLFRTGARRELTKRQIYDNFWRDWGRNLVQAHAWTIQGRNSDWRLFARGITRILNADEAARDQIVKSVIDDFAGQQLSTRGSVLSELLCEFYPKRYPLINRPVKDWIIKMNYQPPAGASEGASYIDMARKMRLTLDNSKRKVGSVRAQNLFELDYLIWLASPTHPPSARR